MTHATLFLLPLVLVFYATALLFLVLVYGEIHIGPHLAWLWAPWGDRLCNVIVGGTVALLLSLIVAAWALAWLRH